VGRPRAFDEDEAVARAMRLFWRRGYPATSVRDLCEVMELGTGSFYSSFESKEALFGRAMQRYLRSLELPPPGPEALARYLERVVADREPRGCLLALSALEMEGLPEPGREIVRWGLAALDTWLARCLGEGEDTRLRARTLTAAVMGLQVRHRAGEGPAELSEIARFLLDTFLLDTPSSPR
jgi:TetR/AcrR family transcriptional repressor of nem operon